jgi:hypothetical protein
MDRLKAEEAERRRLFIFANGTVHSGRKDDTHAPAEPALTSDELVAVRGLIQERYQSPLHERAKLCLCETCRARAEPDSPAASAPGVSGEAVSATPTAPASPRSDPIVLFNQFIQKWVDVGYHGHLLDSDDNDGERIRRAIRKALTTQPSAGER